MEEKTKYSFEFTLTGLPELPNALKKGHWSYGYKEQKKWRNLVQFKTIPSRPETPLAFAKVTFTRHSTKAPDSDNLASSFKGARDGLQPHIIPDDSPKHLEAVYAWQKGPTKGFVTIKIEEIDRA